MRIGSFLGLVVLSSLIVLAEATARADCAGFYAQAWPAAGATGVPTNGAVLVHIGADPPTAFDPSVIVLRESVSRQAVALRVVRDFQVRAAYLGRRTLLLQPTRPLRAATTYTLTLRLSASLQPEIEQSFTTGAGPDATRPVLAAATAGAYVEEEFGCGPARHVPIVLRGLGDTAGPLPWVHMRLARTVADLRAGRLLGEILEPADERGNASIGHGMCAGGWPLEPGDELVVGVSALDSALNESAMRETTARAVP